MISVCCPNCAKYTDMHPSAVNRGRKFCSKVCAAAAKKLPEADRFLRAVQKRDAAECWLWGLAKNADGYGIFNLIGPRQSTRCRLAHRVAYEHFIGPIPDRLFVCHTCDVPACVNPNHLFLGTQTDNMADMVRKGRNPKNDGMPGEYNPAAKLTSDAVMVIRTSQVSTKTLAARYYVHESTIVKVRARLTWSHV